MLLRANLSEANTDFTSLYYTDYTLLQLLCTVLQSTCCLPLPISVWYLWFPNLVHPTIFLQNGLRLASSNKHMFQTLSDWKEYHWSCRKHVGNEIGKACIICNQYPIDCWLFFMFRFNKARFSSWTPRCQKTAKTPQEAAGNVQLVASIH